MPSWVNTAVSEYSKRLKEFSQVNFIEIPLIKRGKTSDLTRIIEKEALLIKNAIPQNAHIIALAIDGEHFSSENLAKKLLATQLIAHHLCFIIGGPEGLSRETLACCQTSWSLSALTLPHPLARIVLLEALYRAFSINHNHPYHK